MGGNWRNLDFKFGGEGGGHVTKYHKNIWGVRVCLNVYVCAHGFIQDFEYWDLQSSVLTWRGCIAPNS